MNTEKRIYYLYDNTSSAHTCNTKIKSNWRKREKGRRFVLPANLEREQYFYKIYPPSNKKLLREK